MIPVIGGHMSKHLHGKPAVREGVGMLLSPCALKSLNSIEKTQMIIVLHLMATSAQLSALVTVLLCQ